MKYIVRLNKHALNPLTNKVMKSRLWEVEQCADKDSEKVIWHCADVRIGLKHIREIFAIPKDGSAFSVELVYHGICTRGSDDALVIDERKQDVG